MTEISLVLQRKIKSEAEDVSRTVNAHNSYEMVNSYCNKQARRSRGGGGGWKETNKRVNSYQLSRTQELPVSGSPSACGGSRILEAEIHTAEQQQYCTSHFSSAEDDKQKQTVYPDALDELSQPSKCTFTVSMYVLLLLV